MTQQEILIAVHNESWQRFRKTLLGLSTPDKLDALEQYCQRREQNGASMERKDEVRVANYINALLRGGLLIHGTNGSIAIHR
jgi:hypothetical protein